MPMDGIFFIWDLTPLYGCVCIVHMNNSTRFTVLDIKRVENAFFHSMYIFSVILHAIGKQDIST